jgi:hypothetical protein
VFMILSVGSGTTKCPVVWASKPSLGTLYVKEAATTSGHPSRLCNVTGADCLASIASET